MPAPQYTCSTEGSVALSAATAKTVVGVKAHANSGLMLCGFTLSFADVNATEVPALVEIVYSTWASNSPGTNSTSTTARQMFGRSLTAGFTCGKNWTAEPTTLTQLWTPFVITPNAGLIAYNFPLGSEPDCALAEGFAMRITSPSATDCHAALIVSRI